MAAAVEVPTKLDQQSSKIPNHLRIHQKSKFSGPPADTLWCVSGQEFEGTLQGMLRPGSELESMPVWGSPGPWYSERRAGGHELQGRGRSRVRLCDSPRHTRQDHWSGRCLLTMSFRSPGPPA